MQSARALGIVHRPVDVKVDNAILRNASMFALGFALLGLGTALLNDRPAATVASQLEYGVQRPPAIPAPIPGYP